MSALVGIRECARQLGVAHSTITRQMQAGILVNRGTAEAPLLDVEEVRAAREIALDPSKRRGAGAPLFDAAAGWAPPARSQPQPGPAVPATEDGLDDGLDDVEAAPAAPSASKDLSYQKARTAREGYAARLAQIELVQRLGQVLDKREVLDAFDALGRMLRERLASRAQLVAGRLAGLTDPNAIAALIAEEDRKLLEQLADDFARRFAERGVAAA